MNLDILKDVKTALEKNESFFKRGAFPKFFTWQELELLLNLRPFNSASRFHFFSKNVNKVKWPLQAWLSDGNTFPISAIKELAGSSAVYISDCSRVNEKINLLCKNIEESTGMSCDAHIYFNLYEENKSGFPIHWDTSHNLIVQIEGRSRAKVWNVFRPPDREKISVEEDEINCNPIIDIEINPGDAIFIPMHMYHKIEPLTKRLSISLPFKKMNIPSQERDWIKI